MLRDTSRNESYRKAIFQNRSRIKDKVVMDLGSGTGILAILCAQVGAKTVYAVEPSAISNLLNATIRENNYDAVIQVIIYFFLKFKTFFSKLNNFSIG